MEYWRDKEANGTIDANGAGAGWTTRELRVTTTQATKPERPPGNRWVLPAAGVLLVAMVALAIVAFTGSGGSTPRRSARVKPVVTDAMQVTVVVGDNWFKPPSLQIKKGATITWDFKGKIPHNITEDLDMTRETFASNTMVSGTFAHTFDVAGTFYYYCTIHHIMQGTVAVSE